MPDLASSWLDHPMKASEPSSIASANATEAQLQIQVCIVGAGMAGLTTAYCLAKAGQKVLLLDAGTGLAQGETSRTTAQLANALDDRFVEIERLHGERGARLAAESHGAAIDFIETTAREEGIECDFERVPGYLCAATKADDDFIEREFQAARRAGAAVEKMASSPWPAGRANAGACLKFSRQAQFHPLRYLDGLARAVLRMGGRFIPRARAEIIEADSNGTRVQWSVVEGDDRCHEIRADSVVMATNTPVNDRFVIHTKQSAYRSYVVALRIPAGTVERALFWDTMDPYHYVRVQPLADDPSQELLLVGGEDHKTGQDDLPPGERYLRLERWARARFPMAGSVAHRWSGQVLEPVDGLAFIGRNPGGDGERIFIATGDSGMGMTHGTLAGLLISDLIVGKENGWTTLYDPARKTLGSLGEFLKENVNTAAQYIDLVSPSDVGSVDEIAAGKGAVMRRGLKKLAVYRDPQGAVHVRSAICPHLEGVVRWNDEAKSWDCPCHGSRFAADTGQALNGPATSPLAEASLE